ncbi:hypothetical protein Sjap_014544 [Stephania japonica]|uniref:Thioredoxin domain-containing protein n=1 Tax=Stephania japonica TaxID=461633 RepID=A0AAP0NQ24_9MAGN
MRIPCPNFLESELSWRRFLTISAFLLFCSSVHSVEDANFEGNQALEWKLLTKRNFTSQIRLHERVLLIVTVPWSGEARTLMREVIRQVAYEMEEFDNLKLMVVYKNKDKVIANVIHATETTTVFCYYHSVSYKYQGRLRAQNILSSVKYLMHLQPEELPLKSLTTAEELDAFLQSTDKAILLLEFCGWSQKLMSKDKTNATEGAFLAQNSSKNGILVRESLFGERNQSLTSSANKHLKLDDSKSEKLTCGVENALSENPLLESYMPMNSWAESGDPDAGESCSFEEFQYFESFFLNLTKFSQEFFLPPERRRYGLIPDRTLLPTLGVRDLDSWLLMVHFAGCPNCSKVFEEGDDLKNLLHSHPSFPTELESEEHDTMFALPGEKPSIILFVDRSSESPIIKRKSMEALEAFRKFVLHKPSSHQMALWTRVKRANLVQSFNGVGSRHPSSPFGLQRKSRPGLAGLNEVKNKVSVMLIDGGGNFAVDDISTKARENSIHEILANLLKHKKNAKLSLLAKEAGFQLLSDDFEVKIANLQSSQAEHVESDKVLPEATQETAESSTNVENDVPNDASKFPKDPKEHIELPTTEPSLLKESKHTYIVTQSKLIPHASNQIVMSDVVDFAQDTKVDDTVSNDASKFPKDPKEHIELPTTEPSQLKESKRTYIVTQSKLIPQASNQIVMSDVVDFAHDTKVDDTVSNFNQLDVEVKLHGFDGFYFFLDGSNQRLRSLTSRSNIPSLIIIDPISDQHYVFPEEENLTYFSLCEFVDAFHNGSLIPYQHSEHGLKTPRETIIPPFVNLDFHEVDSIPRVTALTFYKMVLGSSETESDNVNDARMKDVLVLFSNNWCGFCQRMELVVREVFRTFKGYITTMKSNSRKSDSIFISDNLGGGATLTELPLIYLMDCTLNDCTSILKSFDQRELYPTLMLFPAGTKNGIGYLGDMSVTSVMKFIVEHGSNSHCSNEANGQDGNKNLVSSPDKFTPSILTEDHVPGGKDNDELPINTASRRAIETQKARSNPSKDSPQVAVGTVLVATDKLLNAPPFDKALILIVQVNPTTGFQGLIINKHISWDNFKGLGKGVEGVEQVKQAPFSFGGPVALQELPLVSLSRRSIPKDSYVEVITNVYFLDQFATVKEMEDIRVGVQSADDYWFFLGYSGWGWDQLFAEIAEGAWRVSEDSHTLFHWPGNVTERTA